MEYSVVLWSGLILSPCAMVERVSCVYITLPGVGNDWLLIVWASLGDYRCTSLIR